MIAAASGHLEVCKVLLEADCNPFTTDARGLTALDHARLSGSEGLISLLNEAASPSPARTEMENAPVLEGGQCAALEPILEAPCTIEVRRLPGVAGWSPDHPAGSVLHPPYTEPPAPHDTVPPPLESLSRQTISVILKDDASESADLASPKPADVPQVLSHDELDYRLEASPDGDSETLDAWVVDEADLVISSDPAAIQAAAKAQEQLSSAKGRSLDGEDWTAIEIELPPRRAAGGQASLPARITRTAGAALRAAIEIGEYHEEDVFFPSTLNEAQTGMLLRALRQTAGSLGCVVNRERDPWRDALDILPARDDGKMGEALDDFASSWDSVATPSAFDRKIASLAPLDRSGEADLFNRINRATSEAMLIIARSVPAIDFILAADARVETGDLPFAFLSMLDTDSHPADEGDQDDERSHIDEDEDEDEAALDREAQPDLIELPAAYVAAIDALRTLRQDCHDSIVPAQARKAAEALQQMALSPDFLSYLAVELPGVEGHRNTMPAAFASLRSATRAREAIIEQHLPHVRALAQRFVGQGLDLDDLVQEGSMGLMRAIQTFSPERGHRFWTYAQMWAWQRITRAIADLGSAIRLPVHARQGQRRIEAELAAFGSGELLPSPEVLAEACELPVSMVRNLMRVRAVVALEDVPELGEDDIPGAALQDESAADPFGGAAQSALSRHLQESLERLSPRAFEVIRMRFGLGGTIDRTLREIGDHYDVSRERIRQIEARALAELAHPANSRALKTFLA